MSIKLNAQRKPQPANIMTYAPNDLVRGPTSSDEPLRTHDTRTTPNPHHSPLPPSPPRHPTASHDLVRASHDLVRASHDLVRASHDLVRASHDLVRASHDIVRASHEIVPSSHDLVLAPRWVAALVVDVDEAALRLRHPFDLQLEALGDVVALAHRHVLRQHDVHLDDEVAAEVEGAHRVDEQDLAVVVERDPRQPLEELGPRREARQHLDLLCGRQRHEAVKQATRTKRLYNQLLTITNISAISF